MTRSPNDAPLPAPSQIPPTPIARPLHERMDECARHTDPEAAYLLRVGATTLRVKQKILDEQSAELRRLREQEDLLQKVLEGTREELLKAEERAASALEGL